MSEIKSTLYGARNRSETTERHGYDYYNRFEEGTITLKIKGIENLVYYNVNDFLTTQKQKSLL
jgi:hypothetical protein